MCVCVFVCVCVCVFVCVFVCVWLCVFVFVFLNFGALPGTLFLFIFVIFCLQY